MKSNTFKLNSREEVVNFQELLDGYAMLSFQMPLKHISLVDAFDYLQKRHDGGKVFSALLDLQINFLLAFADITSMGSTWNSLFSKGKLEGGSVLDNKLKFHGKMEIHRFNTSFVLRYRAIWDKIMGLLILMHSPNEYEKFMKASSRKKEFIKIAKLNKFTQEFFLDDLEKLLTDFDNKFRTAEAHGSGVLRKYSFMMESMDKNPQIELVEYWNKVNQFLLNYGKIFDNSAMNKDES